MAQSELPELPFMIEQPFDPPFEPPVCNSKMTKDCTIFKKLGNRGKNNHKTDGCLLIRMRRDVKNPFPLKIPNRYKCG